MVGGGHDYYCHLVSHSTMMTMQTVEFVLVNDCVLANCQSDDNKVTA